MKTVATRRWGSVRIAEGSDEQAIANSAKKKSDAEVPSQVCSQDEEQKSADAAAKKAEGITKSSSVVHVGSVPKMTPTEAAQTLHIIATKLEGSKNPDPNLVAFDLQRVLASIGFQSAVTPVSK